MAMPRKGPITMPTIDPKVVGARLRRVRKARGFNLYDLERVSGIRRMTIAAYESGWRVPMLRNMVRLAIALQRTVDFLLLGRHEK